jgi:hypothetical protein
MILSNVFGEAVRGTRRRIRAKLRKEIPDGLSQQGLVVLDRQNMVSPTFQNRIRNPGLRSHGVNGYHAS